MLSPKAFIWFLTMLDGCSDGSQCVKCARTHPHTQTHTHAGECSSSCSQQASLSSTQPASPASKIHSMSSKTSPCALLTAAAAEGCCYTAPRTPAIQSAAGYAMPCSAACTYQMLPYSKRAPPRHLHIHMLCSCTPRQQHASTAHTTTPMIGRSPQLICFTRSSRSIASAL
jgi:hypothetical protein